MTDPKRTTQLSGIFVSEDARTTRIPRLDDLDVGDLPTVRRAPRKVALSSGDRRATFTLDHLTANGASLTGPLTFTVGDRIDVTFEVSGGTAVTLAAEIVSVMTTKDLITDEVSVRFFDHQQAAALYLE